MDGMLSQDEINALLGGDANTDSSEETGQATGSMALSEGETLTDAECDAVGEISNINMGTAATTLSTLLNQKVLITTPEVSYTTLDEISSRYDRPCVFIHISYIEGISGNNVLILKEDDVKIITDLMMGGDGSNTSGELTDLHLSAIGEAMNQMMGSASTSLSSMLERKVDISPPKASLIDLNDSIHDVEIASFLEGTVVQVAFRMTIGNLIDSEIMQLYPFDLVRDLYRLFTEGEKGDQAAETPQQTPPPQPQPQQQAVQPQQPMMGGPVMNQDMQNGMQMQQPMMQQPMMQQPMQNVNVQPAQFQPFNAGVYPLLQQENIDLIMDVPLEVTVELGRSNKSIKEILDFAPGTIIELNRLAGEPVDVLVNGKFVAKGEVVVIEENFGIRITDISK